MAPQYNPIPNLESVFAANKRRHGRVLCEGIRSSIGEVLDISASGMRVKVNRIVKWREGQVFQVSLLVGTDIVPVTARITRLRRRWFRAPEAGLEFMELTPAVRSALAAMACVGASNRAGQVSLRVHKRVA